MYCPESVIVTIWLSVIFWNVNQEGCGLILACVHGRRIKVALLGGWCTICTSVMEGTIGTIDESYRGTSSLWHHFIISFVTSLSPYALAFILNNLSGMVTNSSLYFLLAIIVISHTSYFSIRCRCWYSLFPPLFRPERSVIDVNVAVSSIWIVCVCFSFDLHYCKLVPCWVFEDFIVKVILKKLWLL